MPVRRGPPANPLATAAADKERREKELEAELADKAARRVFKPLARTAVPVVEQPEAPPASEDGDENGGECAAGAKRPARKLKLQPATKPRKADPFDLDSSGESDSGGCSAQLTPHKKRPNQGTAPAPREAPAPPGDWPQKLGPITFEVVGCQFYKAGKPRVAGEQLQLEREPTNKFDAKAVKVLAAKMQVQPHLLPGTHATHLGSIFRGPVAAA